ncbi:hypothetical protein M2R28_10370 [Aeromonas hydrophila]|uniref:hypothetical protein n=1 Tax=Aeromonas hydrophila TaxID=644 RepID=UPI001F4BFCBA|nr:hypothetical protein [Aeromonas hydrophila]MCO4200083.1 hypothetical protein [Aeromonas hydrophila]UNB56647.1 hypothetical protein MKW86_12740 [Aeromonas hydrophila]
MQATEVHGTPTLAPGARRHRHRISLSSNMSKTAHAGSEPTFYFHVLQYVFFDDLIYKGLLL